MAGPVTARPTGSSARGRGLAAVAALCALALGACSQPGQGSSGASGPPPTAQPAAVHDPVPCSGPPKFTPAQPGSADWPVFGHQGDRAGVDPSTTATTTAMAGEWSVRLDGALFAQPLVVQGIVIEATEHDSIYALDAATGCQYWKTSLGRSFDVTTHHLDCNNIVPELGVTDTPAADTQTGTIFVVPFLDPGRYEMDALDLAGGGVRWRRPIDLPNSFVLQELSRPAIALSSGRAYASFGGRAGDCDNYHGFVVGFAEDGSGQQLLYQASPSREGAIWAPGGPVVLPGGDLLVTTGNTDEQKTYDGSEAVVRLTPDLRRRDLFAPSNWPQLNASDADVSSVGPAVLDGGSRLFQTGKEGVGYLLDAGHLGGIGGQQYQAPISGGCLAIGAVAVRQPFLYVPCQSGLVAIRVSASRFDVAWRGPSTAAGSPTVAGGLVWTYDYEGGTLYGLDPMAGTRVQSIPVAQGQHFASPSASSGRLFLPAGTRLDAFSLS